MYVNNPHCNMDDDSQYNDCSWSFMAYCAKNSNIYFAIIFVISLLTEQSVC